MSEAEAEAFGQTICDYVREGSIEAADALIKVTVSIGVAMVAREPVVRSTRDLILASDQAMYFRGLGTPQATFGTRRRELNNFACLSQRGISR